MNGLSFYSYRKFPSDGWIIDGKHIFPPNAFMNENDWVDSLSEFFPDMMERLQEKYPLPLQPLVYKLINFLNGKAKIMVVE
jgi:hypothetical protein